MAKMGRPPAEATKVVRLPLPVAALAKCLAERTLRAGNINAFLDVEARTAATVPLMASQAGCGFPSPADDHLDRPLDFNELVVTNAAATFAVKIAGKSMTDVGLFPVTSPWSTDPGHRRTAPSCLRCSTASSRSSGIGRRAGGFGSGPRTACSRTSKSKRDRTSRFWAW